MLFREAWLGIAAPKTLLALNRWTLRPSIKTASQVFENLLSRTWLGILVLTL